jgi:hypothetical protein
VKLLHDTLKENGKWSIKRISAFSAFWVAVVYAFIPIIYTKFEVHEFVFWGFVTYSATGILGTVWNKKIDKPNLISNETTNN